MAPSQLAASEPPESAFKPASKQAPNDGDRNGPAKEAGKKAPERTGSVWGVFGRVSSLLSTASSNKKKVCLWKGISRVWFLSGLHTSADGSDVGCDLKSLCTLGQPHAALRS